MLMDTLLNLVSTGFTSTLLSCILALIVLLIFTGDLLVACESSRQWTSPHICHAPPCDPPRLLRQARAVVSPLPAERECPCATLCACSDC